jgi:hypothetical protein
MRSSLVGTWNYFDDEQKKQHEEELSSWRIVLSMICLVFAFMWFLTIGALKFYACVKPVFTTIDTS